MFSPNFYSLASEFFLKNSENLRCGYFFFQNKKQRMMVRTAVLKGKDPLKLLQEMEIIDQMGMCVNTLCTALCTSY